MLPGGMKSLAEIDGINEPDQRLPLLDTLFEYILKETTPDSEGLTWWQLIRDNQALSSKLKGKLRFARETRNAKVHGKAFELDDVLIAERVYRAAIDQVLKPPCPDDLTRDIRGATRSHDRDDHAATPSVESQSDNTAPQNENPATLRPNDSGSPSNFDRANAKPYALLAIVIVSVLLVSVLVYVFRPTPHVIATVTEKGPEVNLPFNPPPGAKATKSDPPAQAVEPKRVDFANFVNRHVSLSTSQRNVALVVDTPGQTVPIPVGDLLNGFFGDQKVRTILNLVDVKGLKANGFFDDFYAGSGDLIREAIRLSGVDYVLLGQAEYNFQNKTTLNPELITCDLTVRCRLADRRGTIIQSGMFSAPGAGFTEAKALENAAEAVARQLTSKFFGALP